MEPNWIRPAYLRVMCLVGIVVMAYGALGFALGAIHRVAPDLQRQGDPIFRIASAIVDVAEPVYREEAASSGEGADPAVTQGFDEAQDELTSQARQAGVNELLRGLLLLGIGAVVFGFHWKRAEAPYARPAQPIAPAYPPAAPPAPPGPPTT
jgi:hypothetical protein